MNWKYLGTEINHITKTHPSAIGFIYKITNAETGEYYIGKKNLYTKRKRKFGKKEVAKITDKRLKHYEYVTKESNWKTYRSSNKDVQKWKEEDLVLEILRFCNSKKGLTYYEIKYLFEYDVLQDERSKNDNIESRYFRKDLEVEKYGNSK